ncbi:hypothetical protein MAR_007951 [Mya arenaria]|uniref:Uncharacterized protein n=1 Tax=Mya arenaria TaxID=6604 RepID=A0ABY7DUI2_MYAAR|nr:hypothetical protein MAR_007951 [Mya arenaria]
MSSHGNGENGVGSIRGAIRSNSPKFSESSCSAKRLIKLSSGSGNALSSASGRDAKLALKLSSASWTDDKLVPKLSSAYSGRISLRSGAKSMSDEKQVILNYKYADLGVIELRLPTPFDTPDSGNTELHTTINPFWYTGFRVTRKTPAHPPPFVSLIPGMLNYTRPQTPSGTPDSRYANFHTPITFGTPDSTHRYSPFGTPNSGYAKFHAPTYTPCYARFRDLSRLCLGCFRCLGGEKTFISTIEVQVLQLRKDLQHIDQQAPRQEFIHSLIKMFDSSIIVDEDFGRGTQSVPTSGLEMDSAESADPGVRSGVGGMT